jgi:hypothetical protein
MPDRKRCKCIVLFQIGTSAPQLHHRNHSVDVEASMALKKIGTAFHGVDGAQCSGV